jgi:hypothetical protein
MRIDRIEQTCYNTVMDYNTLTVIQSFDKYDLLHIDDNGNEVRRYKDGTIRNQNGQSLSKIPNNGHDITRENARSYHAMRKAKILSEIESKLKDVTKTNAPAEAIAAIVGKRAEIAMRDDTKTGNDAAKIVLSAVDAYQDRQPTEQVSTIRNEYILDDDTRQLFERMTRERRDDSTNVLDVTSTDVGDTAQKEE